MKASRLFYAPRPKPGFLRFARWIAPAILRRAWGIEAVDLEDRDLELLAVLRDRAAVLAANHPSLAEPVVLFQALQRTGLPAYFLTAAETMALGGPLFSGFLQRVGCYSVLRGRRDRASMQMTQRLLVEGQRIVIFPEGQTYGLNDTLLPFQQGVVQIGFWALEERERSGAAGPVLVVPLAIKYIYTAPMEAAEQASLRRLERRLGLAGDEQRAYARLRRIAATVVTALETESRLLPAEGESLDCRIDRLRDAMLDRIARALHVDLASSAPFPDRLRAITNAYDDAVMAAGDATESEYQRELREQAIRAVRPLYATWARLKNFIAVRDGYVREHPSAERFLDVLRLLEIEVLGKSRIRGRRRALVRVGEPIDLLSHLEEYRAAKREKVAELTAELERRVAGLLQELVGRSRSHSSLREGSGVKE